MGPKTVDGSSAGGAAPDWAPRASGRQPSTAWSYSRAVHAAVQPVGDPSSRAQGRLRGMPPCWSAKMRHTCAQHHCCVCIICIGNCPCPQVQRVHMDMQALLPAARCDQKKHINYSHSKQFTAPFCPAHTKSFVDNSSRSIFLLKTCLFWQALHREMRTVSGAPVAHAVHQARQRCGRLGEVAPRLGDHAHAAARQGSARLAPHSPRPARRPGPRAHLHRTTRRRTPPPMSSRFMPAKSRTKSLL